ncbi:hypothetical protein HDE_04228 [Halotydeus destructor]|nr:hypothetical protein HDE_04228 [Halotydeus destructor]
MAHANIRENRGSKTDDYDDYDRDYDSFAFGNGSARGFNRSYEQSKSDDVVDEDIVDEVDPTLLDKGTEGNRDGSQTDLKNTPSNQASKSNSTGQSWDKLDFIDHGNPHKTKKDTPTSGEGENISNSKFNLNSTKENGAIAKSKKVSFPAKTPPAPKFQSTFMDHRSRRQSQGQRLDTDSMFRHMMDQFSSLRDELRNVSRNQDLFEEELSSIKNTSNKSKEEPSKAKIEERPPRNLPNIDRQEREPRAQDDQRRMNSYFENKVKLPKYNGTSSYDKWIRTVTMVLELNEIPVERWISKIISAIEEPATEKLDELIEGLHDNNTTLSTLDIDEFLELLRTTMDESIGGALAKQAISRLKQKHGESAEAFMKRFKDISKNVQMAPKDKIHYMVLGLEPELSDRILLTSNDGDQLTSTNVSAKIKIAESYLNQRREDRRSAKVQRTFKKTSTSTICFLCKKPGHISTQCPKSNRRSESNSKDSKTSSTKEKTSEKKISRKEQVVEEDKEILSGNESVLSETSGEETD